MSIVETERELETDDLQFDEELAVTPAETFEAERKALRFELQFGEKLKNTAAAFLLGRVINELCYLYSHAFVQGPSFESSRRQELIQNGRYLASNLGLKQQSQTTIQQSFFREFDGLDRYLSSPQYEEDFLCASPKHAYRLNNWEYTAREKMDSIDVFVSNVKSSFDRIIAMLRGKFGETEGKLDKFNSLAFQIGFHVDRLIHPDWNLLSFRFDGASDFSNDPWMDHYLDLPVQHSAVWNEAGWRSDLRALTAAFRGLADQTSNLPVLELPKEWTSAEYLEHFQTTIAETVKRVQRRYTLQTENLTEFGQARLAQANLEIVGHHLRGRRIRVRLSPYQMRLLRLFLNREKSITVSELEKCWKKVSPACASIKHQSIVSAIGKLSEAISESNLAVTRAGKSCYVLEIIE